MRGGDASSTITCHVEARNEGGTAGADSNGVPVAASDGDGDGVNDDIQTSPGAFNDGSGTFGSITSTGGYTVKISDAAAPDGVRITVTGSGTSNPSFSLCGFGTMRLAPGSDVVITCGSIKVAVISGSATIVLGGGLTVVTVPTGVTAKVSDAGGGAYTVQNFGGGDVTVTVDGVTSTVKSSTTSTVRTWDFQGFTAPVDAIPTVNQVKAGRAIPLKWRVLDSNGAPVMTLTNATITVASLGCASGMSVDLLEETASGSSGLQNLGDGYYQLNWKSPTTYAKSCKTLRLDIGDGVTHDANFEFLK